MGMNWIGQWLSSDSVGVWVVAVFLGGLALNLTPCVYPMIPVTLAFFSAQAAGRLRSTVRLALLYVVGLSLSYAVLGFIAAKTGALLGAWLQQPAVLILLACLVVALALSMFGLYELHLPRWLANRLGQASTGSLGAVVMGMSVGLVAAPCIGPVVLALLLHVGRLANPALGFLLFFVMGLGMGLPYVFLGVWANRLSRWPKAGRWLVWMKRVLGVVLLGLALYLLRPVWRPVIRPNPNQPKTAVSRIRWQSYTAQALEAAKQEKRVALVDVYADWCIPCVELDHVTLRHRDVVQRLAGAVTLRIDATQGVGAEGQQFLDRYAVFGVPTILMFDRQGQEHPELRVNGFVTPQALLERLSKLD